MWSLFLLMLSFKTVENASKSLFSREQNRSSSWDFLTETDSTKLSINFCKPLSETLNLSMSLLHSSRLSDNSFLFLANFIRKLSKLFGLIKLLVCFPLDAPSQFIHVEKLEVYFTTDLLKQFVDPVFHVLVLFDQRRKQLFVVGLSLADQ